MFAAAALTQEVKGNTFSFLMPSDLMFSFNQPTPAQIKVDFNDGQGYQNITVDEPISITYQNGGIKTIKVQLHFSNNMILSSHSRIVVDYIDPNEVLSFNGSGRTLRTVIGASWQGETASATVSIELAAGHTALTKPLIVVEGFDPENDFDYFDLVSSFSGGPGNLNIDIDPSSTFYTLNQAIEDENYDLVFVDFNNSLDYIQRNAYMLEEVIRQVNSEKIGSEKNVVLGISMGGLVARYALRDMEIHEETHDTKLYISLDTPHQGANVPLSIQALARNLVGEEVALPVLFGITGIPILDVVDEFEELEDALALLESPAAQQMLIYQAEGTGGNLRHPQNNTLHDDFMTEYQNMGYPQQENIRNIAISNATDCGTPLDFAPYDVLLEFDESIDDISDFEYFLAGVVDVIGYNPLRGLTSILSTKRDIKAQLTCNALPSQQLERIYNGRIFIRKKLFGFIDIDEDLMDRGTFHSSSDMLPLDSANGGIYDIETFATIPAEFATSVLQQRFSFIPVYSSLDIGEGFVDITPPDLLKKYDATMPPPAPKYVPFDNFHANPFISQAHTQFTLENGNWLIEELKGTPFSESCALACEIDSWEIEGPDIFCDNGTYTLPSGAFEYNWSFPGVTNSDPLTPHIVSVQEHLNGYQTIAATINLPDCNYSKTITKIVYAGVPETGGTLIQVDPNTIPNLSISGETYCTSTGVIITNWPNFEQVTNIEMRKISGQSDWDGEYRSGRDLRTVISSNCNEVFEFEVRVENQCGWSEWEYFSVDITGCPNTCPPVSNSGNIVSENFVISPVPANDWLGIDMVDNPNWTFFTIDCSDSTTDPNGNTNCPTYVGVKLYDFEGNLVIDKPSHQLGSAVDVSALTPGTYILHVSHAGQLETHQIPIN